MEESRLFHELADEVNASMRGLQKLVSFGSSAASVYGMAGYIRGLVFSAGSAGWIRQDEYDAVANEVRRLITDYQEHRFPEDVHVKL